MHGFKSANPDWSQFADTAVGLAAQLGRPLLAEELTPFLPTGWKRARSGSSDVLLYARAHDTLFGTFDAFLASYQQLDYDTLQQRLASIIPPVGLKVEAEERANGKAFGAQILYKQGVLCYRQAYEFVPYSALSLSDLRRLLRLF